MWTVGEYEARIKALEAERGGVDEGRAQADRYKALLLKQRDIMIALTSRLNERDEQILALQARQLTLRGVHPGSTVLLAVLLPLRCSDAIVYPRLWQESCPLPGPRPGLDREDGLATRAWPHSS